MLLKDIIPLITSYYEVKDLKRNLLYSRAYYVADYDQCNVSKIEIAEMFDGTPYIEITIERGCYGA